MRQTGNKVNLTLSEIIGGGYRDFWNFRGRYRIVKGSRGSKKSTTEALWLIYHMMKMPLSNAVVIRRFFNTNRDSTFAQLRWAINRFNVAHLWKATQNPLCLTYVPTGQKIMFRGFDDPQSITSITVEQGVLCWVWIEEAFQITNEEQFNKLDMSIRGEMPPGYFKQITATFNPWSENIFWKPRFFDRFNSGEEGITEKMLCMTTNYMCNEFLDEADIAQFEDMKKNFPRRYDIEGLGNWGIAEGLIFEWEEQEFDAEYMKNQMRGNHPMYQQLQGLDWGFADDPCAFIAVLADTHKKEIYIYDEESMINFVNERIVQKLQEKGYGSKIITADSSEPKSIEEVRMKGLHRVRAAKKGPDSVRAGIMKLQAFKLIVHPRCVHTLKELNNYAWKVDDNNRKLPEPMDDFNHFMDALRYATEKLEQNNFSW